MIGAQRRSTKDGTAHHLQTAPALLLLLLLLLLLQAAVAAVAAAAAAATGVCRHLCAGYRARRTACREAVLLGLTDPVGVCYTVLMP